MEKLTILDETFKIFGVNPDYSGAYKTNIYRALMWTTISILPLVVGVYFRCYQEDPLNLIRIFIVIISSILPPTLISSVELNFISLIS